MDKIGKWHLIIKTEIIVYFTIRGHVFSAQGLAVRPYSPTHSPTRHAWLGLRINEHDEARATQGPILNCQIALKPAVLQQYFATSSGVYPRCLSQNSKHVAAILRGLG